MSTSRLILGAILIILGFGALFRINLWSFIWPAILIIFGLRLILRPEEDHKFSSESKSNQDTINEVVIFSEVNRTIQNKNFKGGKLTTVFGSGNLDLSGSEIKSSPVEMEIVSVFGGSKIKVPNNWMVRSEGVGMFGGYTNHTETKGDDPAIVTIKGAAIFGGVEIVN